MGRKNILGTVPYNGFLKVYHNFVIHFQLPIKPGVTIRDAISKILQKRGITPQMCTVRKGPDA